MTMTMSRRDKNACVVPSQGLQSNQTEKTQGQSDNGRCQELSSADESPWTESDRRQGTVITITTVISLEEK
ncbi:hypothetical protein BTW07_11980 [Salinicola socius]|uniref:Uncharacterized protein n=1 Tax=Salinicola socius TaxID=404433 RepID=A0A1Q8SRJ1_9GAMM|nr:hypothetical protein BTW07_11980 [Salinicola socius]